MIFQDKWTRWHNKPLKAGSDYPSNNGWIYTAECIVAGLSVIFPEILECFEASRTLYGFKRHPDKDSSGISHDEVLGLIYTLMQSGLSSAKATVEELMDQWESQYWQICDIEGFKPTPWYKLNWFGVISDLYQIYKLDRLYTKTDGAEGKKSRHALADYPRVHPVAYHLGGWKRYLVKRHAGKKTSLYEKAAFFFAKLWTIYGSKESGPSQRILGFQLLMLKNKNLVEKVIDKLYQSRYNLKDVATKEYAAGHPVLEKL